MVASAFDHIITALDTSDWAGVEALLGHLPPTQRRVKIGQQLFTAVGPDIVRGLQGREREVFLDLKFHDIPATVAGSCAAAAGLGVRMVTIHASAGPSALEAASEAVRERYPRPLLLAVTVLTSMDAHELTAVGIAEHPSAHTLRLARLAHTCGFDGIVASPQEVALVRQEFGEDLVIVTPGVRPSGASAGDQLRPGTPAQAVRDGADYLVVGRPITQAPDPTSVVEQIAQEIAPFLPACSG